MDTQKPSDTLTDAVREVLEPDIERFAKSFPVESVLHEKLETLFSKIPIVTGVRVLQGQQEYGKDLIFYEQGVCGERRLVACVVKNKQITGSVSSAAGAPTVLLQVRQALRNPYTGPKGESEFVNHVYVISPWPCSQEAMNSVRGELESAKGQVQFVCGRDLFDLFQKYWPAYIYFESNLLSLYLSSLDKLNDNTAFANLLTRGGFPTKSIASLGNLYIRQHFYETVAPFLSIQPFPTWSSLNIGLFKSEIREVLRQFQATQSLLQCAALWSSLAQSRLNEAIQEIDKLAHFVPSGWEAQYNLAVANADRSGARAPSQDSFACLPLPPSAEAIVSMVSSVVAEIANELSDRNQRFRGLTRTGDARLLASTEYLELTKVRMASEAFPWVLQDDETEMSEITFRESILNDYDGPLLVVGAAGFGKTSFCRMATLRDAADFVQGDGKPLPAYVQLYQFNDHQTNVDDDPIEVFLRSPELKRYVKEKDQVGDACRIRLYLDGLDELTNARERHAIVRLAEKASEGRRIQVVITSRAHVVDRNLEWLPRVRLAAFDDSQIDELASKWLGASQKSRFLDELSSTGDLQKIVRVPLLANLTLAVYKEIDALPESTIRLYDMFIQLLCGGWDAAKNIRRESEFGPEPKRTAVTRAAWIAHNDQSRDLSEFDFRTAVDQTLSELSPLATRLLNECVQDGILIRSGDRYSFAHLSFQEYLASKHLDDPSGNRQKLALRAYLNGNSWWDEVLHFFVASTTDPNEMANWIASHAEYAAGRARSRPAEIFSRAKDLIESLKQHHKGFQPNRRVYKAYSKISGRVKAEVSSVAVNPHPAPPK